ncbi:hypothetical protein AAU61_17215 [Desulfocarbo indianensis]|nr:hypothetical protein AAU61_17215 [Desulfocarbo indianensis]
MKKLAAYILALAALLAGAEAWAGGRGGEDCGQRPPMPNAMYQAVEEAQNLMAKDAAAAAKLLEGFIREHPGQEHFGLSFLRGVLAYQRRDLAAAERHFAKSAELWPCQAAALANLAAVKYEREQPLQAAELMLKAHALEPQPRPDYLFQAAAFFLAAAKPQRALPILEELAASPQARDDWLKALVHTHLELKQFGKARGVLNRLLRARPADASLWKLSARLAMELEDNAAAAADLEVAHRIASPAPSGWRNLAGLYRLAGAPKKAAELYRRSFGERPSPRELDILAGVYLEGNYHDQALQAVLKAIASEPSAKRWRFAAQLYMAQKDYPKALAAFRNAAELAPKDARLRLMAGYCALQMDAFQQAVEELTSAVKAAQKDARTLREATRALDSIKSYLQPKDDAPQS